MAPTGGKNNHYHEARISTLTNQQKAAAINITATDHDAGAGYGYSASGQRAWPFSSKYWEAAKDALHAHDRFFQQEVDRSSGYGIAFLEVMYGGSHLMGAGRSLLGCVSQHKQENAARFAHGKKQHSAMDFVRNNKVATASTVFRVVSGVALLAWGVRTGRLVHQAEDIGRG